MNDHTACAVCGQGFVEGSAPERWPERCPERCPECGADQAARSAHIARHRRIAATALLATAVVALVAEAVHFGGAASWLHGTARGYGRQDLTWVLLLPAFDAPFPVALSAWFADLLLPFAWIGHAWHHRRVLGLGRSTAPPLGEVRSTVVLSICGLILLCDAVVHHVGFTANSEIVHASIGVAVFAATLVWTLVVVAHQRRVQRALDRSSEILAVLVVAASSAAFIADVGPVFSLDWMSDAAHHMRAAAAQITLRLVSEAALALLTIESARVLFSSARAVSP